MKILLFLALVFLSLFNVQLHADSLDDQLNKAYKLALKSKKLDPEYLNWIEVHWIPYRDAEADLQAVIAGNGEAGEMARKDSLAETTQARLNELQHIAKDGKSADFPSTAPPGPNPTVDQLYGSLRSAVLAKKDAQLTAALILDQKTWDSFSTLQSDYDGFKSPEHPGGDDDVSSVRFLKLRVAQLQSYAKKLGVDISNISHDPAKYYETDTEVSPDHMLRIEQIYLDEDTTQPWVVSNKTEERAILPVSEDEAKTGRDKPSVSTSDFEISPDEQWIFRDQKFYRCKNGAYLYEKVSGLNYKSATKEPLDILAWHYFEKVTGIEVDSENGIVRFVAWKPGSLRISLGDWLVDFDLKKKTFFIPEDIKAHDRKACKEMRG